MFTPSSATGYRDALPGIRRKTLVHGPKTLMAEFRLQQGGVLDWSHSRSSYISDPNGYEIELAEVWGGGLYAPQ